MNVASALLVVLAVLAGFGLGWLLRGQRMQVDLARVSALREAERAAAFERDRAQANAQVQLRDAFSALSAEALRHNNEAFVELAQQRLEQARTAAAGELAQRQQAIEGMVGPLKVWLD